MSSALWENSILENCPLTGSTRSLVAHEPEPTLLVRCAITPEVVGARTCNDLSAATVTSESCARSKKASSSTFSDSVGCAYSNRKESPVAAAGARKVTTSSRARTVAGNCPATSDTDTLTSVHSIATAESRAATERVLVARLVYRNDFTDLLL